jgi:hypothetical protein
MTRAAADVEHRRWRRRQMLALPGSGTTSHRRRAPHCCCSCDDLPACGDIEVRDLVRARLGRMWDTIADTTGLDPVTVKSFPGFGMLGLFEHIAADSNREIRHPAGGEAPRALDPNPARPQHDARSRRSPEGQHMDEGYTQLGTVLTDQRPQDSEGDGVIVVGRFKGDSYDGVQLSYDAGRRNLYLTPEGALRLAFLLAAAVERDIDIR